MGCTSRTKQAGPAEQAPDQVAVRSTLSASDSGLELGPESVLQCGTRRDPSAIVSGRLERAGGFDAQAGTRVSWNGCLASGEGNNGTALDEGLFEFIGGARPIFENSTACQKSMPIFLSLAQMVLSPVVGGGGFGLAMFFLWLMMNDQLFAGCLCSAGFVTLCGYGFSQSSGWGFSTSTESLILAQDERWRRA